MVKVIIIRGALGCGKTTISKEVAEKLSANYYSMDTILERYNLDAIDERCGCIPEKSFLKANSILVPKLIKDLESGKSVVLDGNFYNKKALYNLLNDLEGYKVLPFTIECKINTCIRRDSKRAISYGRKAAIAVHELVSRFDYGTIIHNDVNDLNIIVKEILDIIKEN